MVWLTQRLHYVLSVGKRWIILGGIVAIGGAVISQLPLSLVGPKIQISGKTPQYSGTIWNGFMTGTDAGTLTLKTSLGKLFSGKNPVHVWGGPDGLSIRAEAGFSGLRALNLDGTMKALALRDPRVARVNGNFRLDIPDMKLMQSCEYADGRMWTNFLSQNVDLMRWKGPELEGPVTCEDGNIIADLSGADEAADISARVTIGLEGNYKADITVNVNQSVERFAGPTLIQSGFHKSGNVYQLTEQGRWQ